jgi:DNA helicase-2/ATP-dependent DNA helicase PcrA
MAKKVILAVAGAGKTYYICHKIDPAKRNLILAFTHENIHNIQKELCDAHGCVPELTMVTTFDSFVYHQLILPYEPSIAEHFACPRFSSCGICMTDPPSKTKKNAEGKSVANPHYRKKDSLTHYVTMNRQYYCATLSELVLQVKKNRESLIKRLAARLNLFFDCILIDEFQDFREYDYELIMALAKRLNDVILVGDYHQHSVSATNNSGKPFKNKSKDVSYVDFVAELRNSGFEIDLTTLDKSRRCSAEICNYISEKLHINIASNGDHCGSIVWIDDDPSVVLNQDQIIKLVFNEAANYTFRAMNWSYSKGDTVDSACVILTDGLDNLDSDSFDPEKIKRSTLNKLYVAMTRSRGDLYLIKASTFKKLRDAYRIEEL